MDFCSELCLTLIKKNLNTQNLVFSPLSYNVILSLIAQGASGDALKEMLKLLQCDDINDLESNSMKMMGFASDAQLCHDSAAGAKVDSSSGSDDEGSLTVGPVIQCVNGIWFDEGYGSLKSAFQDLAQTIYKAHIKSADFQNKADEVVDEANAWAKESTKGLVAEVLKHGELNNATILLGNALYFKGLWKDAFRSSMTMDRHFHLMNRKRKEVPFMTGCDVYSSGSFPTYKVVSIPYQKGENGNTFSMYIFLPNHRLGLLNLLNEASKPGFFRQDFKLNKWSRYDIFWIPKFKFDYYTSEGQETMHEMGLASPFTHGLEEMVYSGKIKISKIVQKSFIEVDEEGTKAAAVTFAYDEVGCCGSPSPPRERTKFIANHPFMFMIREEKTKFILFTGVVLDPTLEH